MSDPQDRALEEAMDPELAQPTGEDETPSEHDPNIVGNDNIREGKVGGTMGPPRAQEGEGQGG